MSVVGDCVRLVHARTPARCSGCSATRRCLFGLVSIGVVGLIVVYHGRAGRSRYLSIALGLLLGGALGNLIDRLRLGYVVDFVDIGHRRPPLVHVQRRRRGDQHRDPAAPRASRLASLAGRRLADRELADRRADRMV